MALSSSLQQLIILALCILPTVKMTGLIIPLYTDPTDEHDDWKISLWAKESFPDLPMMVIINPQNGPLHHNNTEYYQGIKDFQNNGVIVVGYIETDMGSRPINEVEADMDLYRKFYPLDGFFFNKMQDQKTGYEAYYTSLTAYAKSKGCTVTVGSAKSVLPSYMNTVDHVVVWSDVGKMADMSVFNGYPNCGIMSYNVDTLSTTWLQNVVGHAAWVFISDQYGIPGDLPSYFPLEVRVLDIATNANTATSN